MFKITLVFFWLSILLSSATAIRPWLSLTLSDWAFVVGLFFSFMDVARILFSRLQKTRIIYYIGAVLIAVAAVTSGWSRLLAEDIYLYALKVAFTFLVYIPILGWAAADHRTMEKFRDAWIYSGALAGITAELQNFYGGSFMGSEAVYGRMTGLTEHPNELGLLTAVILPQILLKMMAERGHWRLVRNLFLFAMVGAGLLLSVSMTGLICGIVAIVGSLAFAAWKSNTRPRAIATSIVLVVLALPMGYVMRDTLADFSDRITFTRGGEKQTTLDTRILGVNEVVMQSGGLNVLGSGVYAVVDAEGNAVHNMFLRAGVELGLFGMLGLLMITGVILHMAIQKVRRTAPEEFEYKAGLLVSYVVLLIGGQASPVLGQRNLWLPAMFILAPDAERAPARVPERGPRPVRPMPGRGNPRGVMRR